jgi:hypothetical protein
MYVSEERRFERGEGRFRRLTLVAVGLEHARAEVVVAVAPGSLSADSEPTSALK